MAIKTFATRAALAMLAVSVGQVDALKLTVGMVSGSTSGMKEGRGTNKENTLNFHWTQRSKHGGIIQSGKNIKSSRAVSPGSLVGELLSLLATKTTPSYVETTTNASWKASDVQHAAEKVAKIVYRRNHSMRNTWWYNPIRLDSTRLDAPGTRMVHVQQQELVDVHKEVLAYAEAHPGISYRDLYVKALKLFGAAGKQRR